MCFREEKVGCWRLGGGEGREKDAERARIVWKCAASERMYWSQG